MPFDWGQCQIPHPSPGPKGWGFQLTGALIFNWNGAGRLEDFKSELCLHSSLVAGKKWIIIDQFLFYQWFPKSLRKSSIVNCLVIWTTTIFCRPVNLASAGISPLKQLSPFLWMKSVEKMITVFSLGRSSLTWRRHSIRRTTTSFWTSYRDIAFVTRFFFGFPGQLLAGPFNFPTCRGRQIYLFVPGYNFWRSLRINFGAPALSIRHHKWYALLYWICWRYSTIFCH